MNECEEIEASRGEQQARLQSLRSEVQRLSMEEAALRGKAAAARSEEESAIQEAAIATRHLEGLRARLSQVLACQAPRAFEVNLVLASVPTFHGSSQYCVFVSHFMNRSYDPAVIMCQVNAQLDEENEKRLDGLANKSIEKVTLSTQTEFERHASGSDDEVRALEPRIPNG